jgi:hypothetical protein
MENSDMPGLPANEKNKFDSDYRQPVLPSDLEEKTVQELKRRGLFKKHYFFSNKYFKPALALVLIGILFGSGFLIGQRTQHSKTTATSNDGLYLFLLHNPSDFLDNNSHAKEYGQWYHENEKQMVGGEELKEEAWILGSANEKPVIQDKNEISGYFFVHASSQDEALKLAASCPHLKYNGTIEVRSVRVNN